MDTDVLIVGAGPTGLMLANQLGRRGLRPMIIDRHAGPARETRALGVQARTLEIYAHLGIVERALELGRCGNGANLWASGRNMAHVPLSDAGQGATPYPYVLILGQDDNERILGDRLRSWGLSVQWSTELVDIEHGLDDATATLKLPDGSTRKITTGWIAGCDGARSTVREKRRIAFEGAPYEHVFYVADAVVTGNMVPDEVNVYLWKQGFHLLFPMRGQDHWRVVGILPPALRDKQDLKFDDVIPSLHSDATAELAIQSCSWFSTYRIHHRSAVRFRDRRCFLLGDAAHIHSPVGAQGMNTGLQDAYNLAWKLALVIEGRADVKLLDTYEEERMPVARRLLNTTDRAFRLIVSDAWWAGLLRTRVLARLVAFAMKREGMQRFAFRVVSQIGIRYRASTLSQSAPEMPEHAPRAGDRFPWMQLKLHKDGGTEDVFDVIDDRKLALIVIGQSAPKTEELGFDELVSVIAVPADPENDATLARAGIPPCAYYLVRPDGYVGACGVRFDPTAIRRYVSERLRVGVERPRVAPS